METRRCGAHVVSLPDGTQLLQAVVELEDSRVVNYYEFRDELPMTEWLGGEIRIIIDEEGIRRAYWKGRELIIKKSPPKK